MKPVNIIDYIDSQIWETENRLIQIDYKDDAEKEELHTLVKLYKKIKVDFEKALKL